jgi:hypothetical protein
LEAGPRTKLWTSLSQHKGQPETDGGNHRVSIFRLLVGTSLIARDGHSSPTWAWKNHASRDVRDAKLPMEQAVSQVIGQMSFLWPTTEDKPGPSSLRGVIERNSIALLSNFGKPQLDPQSQGWLGRHCDSEHKEFRPVELSQCRQAI